MKEERDLYNLTDTVVDTCVFEGPIDGESPLKDDSSEYPDLTYLQQYISKGKFGIYLSIAF